MNKVVPPYVKILEVLKKTDPMFAERLRVTILETDGPLDKKTRELIRLGIASVLGQIEGVKIHSQKVREYGATKEEIAEVLRIVFISSGVPGLYSAIKAYEEEG